MKPTARSTCRMGEFTLRYNITDTIIINNKPDQIMMKLLLIIIFLCLRVKIKYRVREQLILTLEAIAL